MKHLLINIFLLSLLVGCAPTKQTVQSDDNDEGQQVDKVLITNLINETKIIGEGTFRDPDKNISIKVRPVDTRKFERETNLNNYLGGQHRSVLTIVNQVNMDEMQSNDDEYELLTNKLLDEGLSFSDVRSVIEIIDQEQEASGQLFVYSDPNIQLNDEYEINTENPFALDGRYLTIVEFIIENRSNDSRTVCDDMFLLRGNTTNYKNIPTSELLGELHAGSIQFELLHKLLMNKCEVIPSDSKLKTHLVFPSFYDMEELTIHYRNDQTALSEAFRIEKNRSRNQYFFSRIRVTGFGKSGYRILSDDDSPTSESYDAFHFIKIGNSVDYVGFQNFLIHDKIDLSTVEILTIRFMDSENVELVKTPITKQDISRGTISAIGK